MKNPTDLRIRVTNNYRMFERSKENRLLDMKKHRRLKHSMEKYGFLKCFPLVCIRNSKGSLVVKDGQHRLAIAEELGLAVYWVEQSSEEDFDVALANGTVVTWTPQAYAEKHAANGLVAYREALAFHEEYHIPLTTACALLAGTVSYSNIVDDFKNGLFKIRERNWATNVASLYGPMCSLSTAIRNVRFLEACMAVCRIPDFDRGRMLLGAERCRDKLVSYSNREAYLDMMEVVYNFGRHKLCSIKIPALEAMRERNSTSGRSEKKPVVKLKGESNGR